MHSLNRLLCKQSDFQLGGLVVEEETLDFFTVKPRFREEEEGNAPRFFFFCTHFFREQQGFQTTNIFNL